MDQDTLLRELEKTRKMLREEELKRALEVASIEDGINVDLHLLPVGRPGVGKSTFVGELTGGIFKGSSGPSGGTKISDEPGQWRHIKTAKIEETISTKIDESDTKKVYFIHDTVGLGTTVNLGEMKKEIKEVFQQNSHGIILLCLGWGDRMGDINESKDIQTAFDVCNSLDMWQNVVVVITKCNLDSPESHKIARDWEQCVTEKLESMNVEGSEIAKITKEIVFYPDYEIPPLPGSQDHSWGNTLMRRLKDTIQSEKNRHNKARLLSSALSLVVNLILRTCKSPEKIRDAISSILSLFVVERPSSDDDQVQISAEPNQNTDGSFSQSSQQVQSGNEKSLDKKDTAEGDTVAGAGVGTGSGGDMKAVKVQQAKIAGGITGGIAGGIGGGIAGGVIGGKVIGGAMATTVGATIGAVGGVIVGGVVGGVIFALIVYFLC